MKKTVNTVLLIFLIILASFSGCGEPEADHKHAWIPQTCTEPLKCTICGATKGEPWNHRWTDATCLAPSTCLLCGITRGEALEHTWREPTFQEPKMCSVCGTATDEYLAPEYEVVATYDELYSAAEGVVIFSDNGLYGAIDNMGNVLIEARYNYVRTLLWENCFALGVVSEEDSQITIFDATANKVWEKPSKYKDYEFIGYAGGYVTLRNSKDNIWVYFDGNDGFKEAAYIEASLFGKEKLSLANSGIVTALSVSSLGYPYIDLSGPNYVSGEIDEDGYLEARGCAANSTGDIAVSYWKKDKLGKYSFDSAGFYNVNSLQYTKITDWYDEQYNLAHFYINDGSGVNEYDSYGNFALLQSGIDTEGNPTYDIYDMSSKTFITELGVSELYLSNKINIAGIKDSSGKMKYSYLNSSCELTGSFWDEVTFMPDDISLVIKNGQAYFMNADLAVISNGIPALFVDHRFSGYFILKDKNGSHLLVIE